MSHMYMSHGPAYIPKADKEDPEQSQSFSLELEVATGFCPFCFLFAQLKLLPQVLSGLDCDGVSLKSLHFYVYVCVYVYLHFVCARERVRGFV